jgi:cation diffusion facilitator family transporter
MAYVYTDSISLLSDAAESLVNLVAAILALIALTVAARPADEDHLYGHSKAEYFSSGVEGILILIAAIGVGYASINRLMAPMPLQNTGLGLIITAVASVINFLVARVLMRVGKMHRSITLEADAQHLLADVWTSLGVIIGVVAVNLTGWDWLDPAIALVVTVNIVRTGFPLISRSVQGLMDTAIPLSEQAAVRRILDGYAPKRVHYHALRTRQAGSRRFISFHVLVPGHWTVQRGHQLLEQIEADIRSAFPETTVFTHLEPVEDPASQHDVDLDREERLLP